MESLTLDESTGLDSLPIEIICIILAQLDTAQSLAHLAQTCKALHQLVKLNGWRIFVSHRFPAVSLSPTDTDNAWLQLARSLTSMSRDWDRRAFVVDSLRPHGGRQQARGRRQGPPGYFQSIPESILVDAHSRYQGRSEHEFVVWGAGEDVVARVRRKHDARCQAEGWHTYKGVSGGYHSGRDDITCIKIPQTASQNLDESPNVLVGRLNGNLRLLSLDGCTFGNTIAQFEPTPGGSHALGQKTIQSFDYGERSGILAAASKENILIYSLEGQATRSLEKSLNSDGFAAGATVVRSIDGLSLRSSSSSSSPVVFDYIRTVKFVNQDIVAVALNRGHNPIQYLSLTPASIRVTSSTHTSTTFSDGSTTRTVRALLPIDLSSVVSGGGSSLLSSWDDGTIRLHDYRTPSLVDRVYQDNFDISTPTNALISDGLERFVAGSAYTSILKVFDFRWPKSYYHTDGLPCGRDTPYPIPRPPTAVRAPHHHSKLAECDHLRGRHCRWHALSRLDFYRPNYTVFLSWTNKYGSNTTDNSPIYSLARSSDTSPTIYAGQSGGLVELTLKSGEMSLPPKPVAGAAKPPYTRFKGTLMTLETGDGWQLRDVSQSSHIPSVHHQKHDNRIAKLLPQYRAVSARHRLDESFQDYDELATIWKGCTLDMESQARV